MKHLKILTLNFGLGIFLIGNSNAQSIGDWLDGSGGLTNVKTYTLGSALGIGTQTPRAWAEILYCPYVTPSLGFAVTSDDICYNPNGGGSGTGSGGVGDPNDPNSPPPSVPGSLNILPMNFPSGTGYYSLPGASTGPLMLARTQSASTPLGSTGIMGIQISRFLVNPDGRTGINTSNPRAYLDVVGGLNPNEPIVMFGVKIQQKGNVTLGSISLTEHYTRHLAFYPKVTAGFGNSLTQPNDQVLLFTDGMQTDGTNLSGGLVIGPLLSGTNQPGGIRINAMGNLEIKGSTEITGDILMHGKTEMRGELLCNGLKSKPKWWPDFVFSNNYELISLDSLEIFIKQNEHLPGMPSQDSVVQYGQDIPLIQQIQQQKIEELTLYIIELNKKIGELKAVIGTNSGLESKSNR